MPKKNNNFTREHLLFLRKQRVRGVLIHAAQVGILVLFLCLWELAAALNWIDPFIMSSPSRVWKTLLELSAGGTLWYQDRKSTRLNSSHS